VKDGVMLGVLLMLISVRTSVSGTARDFVGFILMPALARGCESMLQ
jgi:hypothetical protein